MIDLILGDCIEVMKEIKNESIDLVIADPPYMISQEGKKISRKGLSHKGYRRNMDIKLDFGEWDNFRSQKDFFNFTELWFKEVARIIKSKSWVYIFFDRAKVGYFDLLLAPKYKITGRELIVWHKTNPCPQFRKVNWLSASEFIWVGSKGECKLKNYGQVKDMHNVIDYQNKSGYGVTDHPTEKPVFIIKKFIETSSNKGELVLDPFMGSGATGVACKELGRNFVGIEKEEKYFKMAEQRIKNTMESMV